MAPTIVAIVALIRTFVPFTILRWPLAGAILAIIADAADVMIFQAFKSQFGSGLFSPAYYHNFDKFFDIYYLSFEFLVVLRWKDAAPRTTAIVLFLWRAAGLAAFEISTLMGTPIRWAFLAAPNIFENFYLFWAFRLHFFPQFKLTKKRLLIILLAVGLPKIAQEYVMHYRFLDQTWGFIRDHFFYWLYE